jgi:2-methylisocitrate lyase-like PEP mutase family enzyme
MSVTQLEKARRFRALHEARETFVMPNPWDAGSARLLANLGFPALATSSFACAAMLGRHDHQVTREEALAHAQLIVGATDLPVSADLERGFGDAPAEVAQTIELAAAAGLVGGSIEDSTADAARPIFEFNQAVERVCVAVEAAGALSFPFVLTARAENFLHGSPDLEDTIRRLRAYERAGADVLFAPGLPDLDAVRAVCAALTKPVSFMCGLRDKSFSVAELAAAGVRRVSVGPSLHRAAMGGLLEAAREVRERGTFGYVQGVPTGPELYRLIKR